MPQSIPLTRGFVALVDDADYPTVSQWKWLYVGSGYAGRFVSLGGRKLLIYLHRFLLEAQPDQRVDHINGDGLDNRRENLRLATVRENLQNRRCSSRSRSGMKGVSWHKAARKWDARITLKGVRIHLGYYDDLEAAALMYDAAARLFFGEFSRPNFPKRPTPPEIQQRLEQILRRRARLLTKLLEGDALVPATDPDPKGFGRLILQGDGGVS
jgi:hypothetical protein